MEKISMYNATVPELIRSLEAMKGILAKAERYVSEKKIEDSNILQSRLALDQFPFVKQVQIISDYAKGTAARLAGVENPKMEDTEKTLSELTERLDKTIAFLKTLTPESFEGSEEREVPIYFMPGKFMYGLEYLNTLAIPNFYFHLTTAYSILRHYGMDLGKADFIGAINLRDQK